MFRVFGNQRWNLPPLRRGGVKGYWRAWAICCFLLLSQALAPAAPVRMTAHLDRENAAVGESVTLTLTFEGVSPKSPPNLPALPNVQANYSGQSSSFTFVNG